MALSERDKEIYIQYSEKYGRPTKSATTLIAFAETPEINKPISYETARQIIKYFLTHPSDKSYIKQNKKRSTARNKSQTTTSTFELSQQNPGSSASDNQQKTFKSSIRATIDYGASTSTANPSKQIQQIFANKQSSGAGKMDEKERENWKIGDKVQLFSTSKQTWFDGKIIDIINNDEGEWLNVRYGINEIYHKEIGRYSEDIRQIKGKSAKKDLALKPSTMGHGREIQIEQNEEEIFDVLDAGDDGKEAEELREKFFEENDDPEVPIKPIYYAAKRIDDKYKLIFKPECNYTGCCNKPEIDPKLLKGDMYICKKHRIEIGNEMQQTHGDNFLLKQIINKFQTYDDEQFYEEGKKLEDNDYFLQTYSKIQQQKMKIVLKLSLLENQMCPEYWEYMLQYKQLEEQSKLLCSIRNISNPFFAILANVAIMASKVVAYAGIAAMMEADTPAVAMQARRAAKPVIAAGIDGIRAGVAYFKGSTGQETSSTVDNTTMIERESENQQAEQDNLKGNGDKLKTITECQAAMKVLYGKIVENENMKKDCDKKINGIDEKIVNYQKEIKCINEKMEKETEDMKILETDIEGKKNKDRSELDKLDEAIKRIKEESKQISFEQIKELSKMELEKQRLLNEYQGKQRLMELEKMRHEKEIEHLRNKRKAFEDSKGKLEEEIQELDWEIANQTARMECADTIRGRVSLYIVYDGRKEFTSTVDDGWDVIQNPTWRCYGNYAICKIDGRLPPSIIPYLSPKYREFTFMAEGRRRYWYSYENEKKIFMKGNQLTFKLS